VGAIAPVLAEKNGERTLTLKAGLNLRLIHIFEAGKDKIKFELDRLSGIWRGRMWLNDGQYCPKITRFGTDRAIRKID
jgi:hypothetical protein